MSGVTPCISMNKIAARLDELDTGESITEALDEVEYLSCCRMLLRAAAYIRTTGCFQA